MKLHQYLPLQCSALGAAMLLSGCSAVTKSGAAVEPPVSFEPVPAEVVGAILNATAGQSVNVAGIAPSTYPRLQYTTEAQTGIQYIISDDPEYIRVPEAVAIRERVEPGSVRLYVYNVNGVREPEKMPRRINSTIRNLGAETLTVNFLRYATHPPTTNYFGVAKKNLRAFQESRPGPTLTVPAGATMALDPALEEQIALFDELVHGWYEFTIDQPAEISVVQTDPETSSAAAAERITEILAPKSLSGAGRGLFKTANLNVTVKRDQVVDTARGPVQLVIADGEQDPWVVGHDSYTNAPSTLKGNYGVLYEVELERASSDGRALALLTWNFRAGSQWCGGMANVIRVSDGKFPGGLVDVPSDQLVTREFPEMVLLQVFPPLPKGEKETVRITYSPPGASCLPTPLIFLPIDWE